MNNKGKKDTLGKILYYDPNPADNQPIQTEDLNILVELSTVRKDRTIIAVDLDDGTFQPINDGAASTRVSFIDGTKQNGIKSLTTNYTELGTDLGEEFDDLEGLGITNIDIRFNNALAPLIKINFTDVRGGALIGKGNESKYRAFFDLPYPIFKLKVKGE